MSTRKRPVACLRCNKKKVKCAGGCPCQTCALAGVHCSYPIRDRNVTVPESYLASLQAQALSQLPAFETTSHTLSTPAVHIVSHDLSQNARQSPAAGRVQGHDTPLLKDSTAESFVTGLKKLSRPRVEKVLDPLSMTEKTASPDGKSDPSIYEYVPLEFDSSTTRITIRLPPYPYALQLVQQFEDYIGHEYHWYMRSLFKVDLNTTYREPGSEQARDRVWLCKLLTVLALGESYSSYHSVSIEIADVDVNSAVLPQPATKPPPGAAFFEQALALFKIPSEQPTVAHVEAMNVMAFYCYSLNRRKTAYTYTGLAVRIASLLLMHQPTTERPVALGEHYKRVWWTTYLMDNMTSPEVGLKPVLRFSEALQPLPSDDGLSVTEQTDFSDADIHAMHLHLCNARNNTIDLAIGLQQQDFANYGDTIQTAMEALSQWRLNVPSRYSFDFSSGIPPAMRQLPSMRSLSSIYLRFHQGYILLIRPIFIKLLAVALGKDSDSTSVSNLVDLALHCVEAATNNMRILRDLSMLDRLARYGFWESLHLFSAINIFALARLAHALQPFSLNQTDEDLALYDSAKTLLHDMAVAGNAASKGHMRMIEEIDQILETVFSRSAEEDPDAILQMADLEQDIFQWINSIDQMDQFPD